MVAENSYRTDFVYMVIGSHSRLPTRVDKLNYTGRPDMNSHRCGSIESPNGDISLLELHPLVNFLVWHLQTSARVLEPQLDTSEGLEVGLLHLQSRRRLGARIV